MYQWHQNTLKKTYASAMLFSFVFKFIICVFKLQSNNHTNEITFRPGKEGNVLFNDTLNTFYLRLDDVDIQTSHSSNNCTHLANVRAIVIVVWWLYFPRSQCDVISVDVSPVLTGNLQGWNYTFIDIFNIFLTVHIALNTSPHIVNCSYSTEHKSSYC